MRKLILIPFLLLSLWSFGQTSLATYSLPSATGTDTYSYSPTTAMTLTNGATLRLKFTNANTTTATLNISSTGAVALTKADGTALSSGDITAGSVWWVIYDSAANKWKLSGGSGGGGGTVSSIATTSPITGGTITTTGTIGINNAAADGSTKGAASFTANDFDASSGNISIDYTNGQESSGSNKGFLTSTDWTTFNNKQSAITFGTGVQTALGVNIGTAGSFIVNGGALGTPSSGVATNLTGTASGLTAGTVTTNANLTGAITSSGNATSLGSFTSSNLRGALTDELGTGATLFDGATPTSLIGTNITGIPISTGLTGGSTNRIPYFTSSTALSVSGAPIFDGTNLGIGVTPQSLLTVSRQSSIQSPVSGSTEHIIGLDANPLRITFDTHNNASASGTAFMVRRSRGTSASPSALSSGDVIAAFSGRGYGTTQYAAASTGLINIKANQTFTDANNGTYISFDATPDNSVTAAEVFRFGGSGQLGIGGANFGSSGNTILSGGSGAAVSWGQYAQSNLSGLGTGVSTWLGTPSWTNFNSAITGTAPYWSLASGGTLTGNQTITGPTLSGLTASTESIRLNFDFSQTKTFNTGAITTQREVVFQKPTYSVASTITKAATVAIADSPAITGGGTITNPYSLWVQAGATQLDGNLAVVGTANITGSLNASSNTAIQNYYRIAPTYTMTSNNSTAFIMQGSPTLRASASDIYRGFHQNQTISANAATQTIYGWVVDNTYGGMTNSPSIINIAYLSGLSSSSGTASFKNLIQPTYNTLGSYSGTGIDLDIDPVLTSTTGLTHLALRATSGQVLLGGTTVTTSTRVDQRGLGTTNSTINHRWADSGNTLLGTVTDDGTLKINHIGGNTSAPSIAAGAGAGTGPTVVVTNATDMSGIVDVTTGTTPTGTNSTIATITFNKSFASAPNIQLTPNNANAAGLAAALTMVYVTSTTTTFVVTSGTTALTASTQYKWFYSVIQ